ncbi:MAG TPA: hypothetical protein VJT71_19025 [Pyrinomonadaceae bacterium]|nr:hypothetical protein [Pyrinomonadaceae bacterium]
MSKYSCSRVLLCAVAVLALNSSIRSQADTSKKCTEPAKWYEENNYRVHDVRIDSPLAWLLGSVDKKLNDILTNPSMPIRKGAAFRKQDEDEGFLRVKEKFPELTVSKTDRIAFRLARPTLENCDKQSATLDVVYRVYTFSFSNYLSRVFEKGNQDEVKRSVVETDATERLANYFPQPLVGFNRTRNPYGGTKLTINQPDGLLDKISLKAIGSSRSDEEAVEAVGAKDLKTGFIRRVDYAFGYQHSAVPATSTKLKEGSGLGQIIVATKPMGERELMLRFGMSFEAGNKQTSNASIQLQPGDVAQSPYGAVKVFAGGTVRLGRHAFKASYGVEFGSASKEARLDFVKQIFDAAADLRFLPKDHHPIVLNLELTGGAIQRRGMLPVATRFFGGNAERNFITSSDWIIRDQPFIRSFPENHLAQSTSQTFVGGDRFYSANVTAAVTMWAKPLVPSAVLKEPDFEKLVDFEFNTARNALSISYLEETEEFHKVAKMSFPIGEKLAEIRTLLSSLADKHLGDEIDAQIQICQSDADDVEETLSSIKSDLTEGNPKSADVRTLAVGFPTKTPPIPSEVSDLLDDLSDLKDLSGIPDPAAIGDLMQQMEGLRLAMATAFGEVTDPAKSEAARTANERARQSMVYPRRVFRELSHEANLFGVSPVFIFDAARLRQNTLSPGTVRYGVGGGLRLSIVSLDVTAGYAFNPNRKPWESRGAFLFSMEVSNLFR